MHVTACYAIYKSYKTKKSYIKVENKTSDMKWLPQV